MTHAFSVAAYRTRRALARRWGDYLSIVVLIGLLGGLALGALAAARSTESSMAQLARSQNVPDLFILDGYYNPTVGLQSGYNAALLRTIRHLPHVKDVRSEVGLTIVPVTSSGHVSSAALGPSSYGSVDGLDFLSNRLFISEGRLANPQRADEFNTDPATARQLHLHVGETVTLGWITNAQGLHLNGSPIIPRTQRTRATLVGLGATPFTTLFNDESSANNTQGLIFTPPLTRRLAQCCANDMISGIQLTDGSRDDALVENELHQVLPKGVPFTVIEAAAQEAKAARTLRPDAIALDFFGGISALVMLLIVGQILVRRASSRAGDLAVLRALGASQAMTAADDLIGTLGAILVGAILSVLVAIVLSPLDPLGPVHPYLPTQLHVDGVILGVGGVVIAVALAAVALVEAVRWTPVRETARAGRIRRPVWGGLTTGPLLSALPVSATTGVHFALDPGSRRERVPVRSAMLSAALAMVVVTANLTFGASLASLVSHPAQYGWNWNYLIDGGGGLGDIPQHRSTVLLNADHLIAGWSGVYFSALRIDGHNVAVMGGTPNASVGPPVLTGHGFDGPNQVVLGSATLALLHKGLGQTVSVSSGHGVVSHLTIVGTATMPSIGVAGSSHLEMGSGALLSYRLIPPSARNTFDSPLPGPNAILVRLAPGASNTRAMRSLNVIAAKLRLQVNGGSILGVQRPAEIRNYGTLGNTPALLGGALALGASIGLALTLVTLVRRRRRDLALLKTLGFTKRQVAATIAWQATVDVGIGCVVGVPLGVLAGRSLWVLFARSIYVLPRPAVPLGTIVLSVLAALVLANVAAAVPARVAARTQTAILLRAE